MIRVLLSRDVPAADPFCISRWWITLGRLRPGSARRLTAISRKTVRPLPDDRKYARQPVQPDDAAAAFTGVLLSLKRQIVSSGYSICRTWIRIQPSEEGGDVACGKRDTGIGSSVIEVDRVSIRVDRLSTWKHYIVHVSSAFIWSFGSEHPGFASLKAKIRPFEIEQCEAQTIDAAGGCAPNPVIDRQPSF